jgi:hypothetical protein
MTPGISALARLKDFGFWLGSGPVDAVTALSGLADSVVSLLRADSASDRLCPSFRPSSHPLTRIIRSSDSEIGIHIRRGLVATCRASARSRQITGLVIGIPRLLFRTPFQVVHCECAFVVTYPDSRGGHSPQCAGLLAAQRVFWAEQIRRGICSFVRMCSGFISACASGSLQVDTCVGLGPSSRVDGLASRVTVLCSGHLHANDTVNPGWRFQVCTVRVLTPECQWLLTQRASQVHLYPEAPNLELELQLPLSGSDRDNTARKEAAPGVPALIVVGDMGTGAPQASRSSSSQPG